MIAIPMLDLSSFTQQVPMDGILFNLKIVWNTRGEFWTLSIRGTDDIPIVNGIKMVLGFALLNGYRHITALPPGDIFVSDPTENVVRPGRKDFFEPRKLELIYATEAELASV